MPTFLKLIAEKDIYLVYEVEMKLEDRFWSKVQKTDNCWLWLGSVLKCGYGSFKLNGHTVRAHRIAWMLTYNSIPEGELVCHHCDNGLCMNPEHLFLGTQKDNIRDMITKGRSPTVGKPQLGETNRNAKLTEVEALTILKSPLPCKELADLYPVSLSQIYNIKNGYRWSFIGV